MCENLLKSLSVLYVEDEEDIREMLKEVLEEDFLVFDVAKDGLDALGKFKRKEYDLVITDIEMPRLDGMELAKKIKERSPFTPVILLTAYSQKERLFKAIDIGINKYLVKPFTPEKLLEAICEVAKKFKKSLRLDEEMVYDYETKEVKKVEDIQRLTKKESAFLELLLKNPEKIVSIDEIKEVVWGGDFSEDALRALVKRVRKKTKKELIQNIPSQGYKINISHK